MRLFFLLVFSWNVFAAENWFPVEQGGNTVYAQKEVCERAEGSTCYDVSSCPRDECSVVDAEVDDYTKPVYKTPYNVETCATNRACAERASSDDYCEEGDIGFWREVAGRKETYCTKLLRYQKKTVKQLQEDATKKSAKVAEAARILAEKQQIEQRVAASKAESRACMRVSESATNAELVKCIKELSLLVLKNELTAEDVQAAGAARR